MTGDRSHTVFYCSTSVRSLGQQDESQRDFRKEVEGRINRILSWWPGVSVREGRRLAPLAWDAAYLRFKLSCCCTNPKEVRDYGKPGRGYYGGVKASDQSGTTRGTAGHSEFAHLARIRMKT